MRKRDMNTIASQAKYISLQREQKAELHERVAELESKLAVSELAIKIKGDALRECQNSVSRLRQKADQCRFTLLKFEGYNNKTNQRELFDVYAIEIGTGNSFPLTPGYDDIEVYTKEVS